MKKGLSASAKGEILAKELGLPCCERAFLSAIIHTAGFLLISSGRLSILIKETYQGLKERLDLSLKCLYDVESTKAGHELLIDEKGLEILMDCAIIDKRKEIIRGIAPYIIKNNCCKSAYAEGVFVGCGGLSASRSGYHLEFSFESSELANDFTALLARLGIFAKQGMRREKNLVYLKDNDSIIDCLAFCGMSKTTLAIGKLYVDRSIRRQSNRQLNCDMANMDRMIGAGLRQAHLFSEILDEIVDPKLLQTAKARIENPETSYEKLGEMLGVSKSGIKHRLKKLEELAAQITSQSKKDETQEKNGSQI